MCSALYDLSERIEHFINQQFDLFCLNRARMLHPTSICAEHSGSHLVEHRKISYCFNFACEKSPITLNLITLISHILNPITLISHIEIDHKSVHSYKQHSSVYLPVQSYFSPALSVMPHSEHIQAL